MRAGRQRRAQGREERRKGRKNGGRREGRKKDDAQERSALVSCGTFGALTFKVLHSLCTHLSLSVRYLSTGATLCATKHTHAHTHFPTSVFIPLRDALKESGRQKHLYMRSQ